MTYYESKKAKAKARKVRRQQLTSVFLGFVSLLGRVEHSQMRTADR